jgi:hypothetical protein
MSRGVLQTEALPLELWQVLPGREVKGSTCMLGLRVCQGQKDTEQTSLNSQNELSLWAVMYYRYCMLWGYLEV